MQLMRFLGMAGYYKKIYNNFREDDSPNNVTTVENHVSWLLHFWEKQGHSTSK